MFNFDFDNGATSTSGFGSTVSNIDGGVTFTVTPVSGQGNIIFTNGSTGPLANINLLLSLTQTLTETFTLSLLSGSNNLFSGATGSPLILDLGNTTDTSGLFAGTWSVTFLTQFGGTGTKFSGVTGNQNLTVANGVAFSGIKFTTSTLGFLSINGLSGAAISCFCADTRISTPEGSKAVETLAPGDVVLTADGRRTAVRWLGQQTVAAALNHPRAVNPICISAGALGDGLPKRDLWLSADHAVEIGGVLCNAGALVNGETITQVRQMPESFSYYHIETEAHELILAEGVAAETYVDYIAEGAFDNEDQRETRLIPEMALPRVSSARLVPEDVRRRCLPLIAAE